MIELLQNIPFTKVGNQTCQQKEAVIKNNEQFYFTGKLCKRGHIAKRFTANSVCVECDTFHKLDKNRAKNYELEKKYGITIEEYERLLKLQNYKCKICNNTETKLINKKVCKLAVDHCHITGKIRGLLCYNCNVGIGFFRNNPKILKAAALYCEES